MTHGCDTSKNVDVEEIVGRDYNSPEKFANGARQGIEKTTIQKAEDQMTFDQKGI